MLCSGDDFGGKCVTLEPGRYASLRAVGSVSLLTLVQLLLQFATQLLLARYFGTAGEVDAFMAAVALPLVIAAMVSGSLGYVLVPVVAEALARQNTAAAAVKRRPAAQNGSSSCTAI